MRKFYIVFSLFFLANSSAQDTIKPVKTIRGKIAPKSIVHSGNGLFFAQNMMYRHTVTVYNRNFELVKTISDRVKLKEYGHNQYEGYHRGAPVECTFSHGGKYAWISNYEMSGSESFSNPGCDECNGEGKYDSSFVYKIDTETLEILNAVKVGSVPKYLAVSPGDEYLLVSNWSSGNVSIVDLKTEKEIKRINVGRYPRGIVMHPVEKLAYVAVMGSNKISCINLADFTVKHLSGIGKSPRHICIDSRGENLYISLNGEGKVKRYNLKTAQKEELPTGRLPRSMVLSGKWLYVVNYGNDTYCKINTETLSVTTVGKTSAKPIGITLDETNGQVWVACYSGSIQVFDDPDIRLKPSEEFTLVSSIRDIFKQVASIFIVSEEKQEPKEPFAENPDSLPIVPPVNKPNIPTESKANSGTIDTYHIIVGSFKNEQNAKKMVNQYKAKGYTAEYFKNKELFACSIYQSADLDKTQSESKKLNKSGTDNWILKK